MVDPELDDTLTRIKKRAEDNENEFEAIMKMMLADASREANFTNKRLKEASYSPGNMTDMSQMMEFGEREIS